ncbi:hypothetical protein GW764_03485 [Candidatus Parcubacteria bacterium]|nr:hypothetical protein [Candidatus Parcubacteria bacterium]
MKKFLSGIIILVVFVGMFALANVGMWDRTKVYLVEAPNKQVVVAYLKAIGHTGHKKFLSETESMEFDDFTVIKYRNSESVSEIVRLAGKKAWVDM